MGLRPIELKEAAEDQGTERIAKRERQDVPADLIGGHIIKIRQHKSISEENRVIKERLCAHERQSQKSSCPEGDEERLDDLAKRRVCTRVQPQGRERRGVQKTRAMRNDSRFDVLDYFFGFRFPAMDDEPARAFRDPGPQEKNHEAECGTNEKGEPPAGVGAEAGGIEKDNRSARPEGGADPERTIDGKVGKAAIAGRNHFLNCGIHRAVFAADPSSRQHPEETKACQIPGERRGGRRNEIKTERDKEERPAAEPVGQPAKAERADDGAGEIKARREPDVGRGEPQAGACFEGARDRSGKGDFETIQHPGDSEGDGHQRVKPSPGKTIETGGDAGFDRLMGRVAHVLSLGFGWPNPIIDRLRPSHARRGAFRSTGH